MTNDPNQVYQSPYAVPLRIGQFGDVHIYIKDKHGSPATFIKGTVTVTLIFKKLPFQYLRDDRIYVRIGPTGVENVVSKYDEWKL